MAREYHNLSENELKRILTGLRERYDSSNPYVTTEKMNMVISKAAGFGKYDIIRVKTKNDNYIRVSGRLAGAIIIFIIGLVLFFLYFGPLFDYDFETESNIWFLFFGSLFVLYSLIAFVMFVIVGNEISQLVNDIKKNG